MNGQPVSYNMYIIRDSNGNTEFSAKIPYTSDRVQVAKLAPANHFVIKVCPENEVGEGLHCTKTTWSTKGNSKLTWQIRTQSPLLNFSKITVWLNDLTFVINKDILNFSFKRWYSSFKLKHGTSLMFKCNHGPLQIASKFHGTQSPLIGITAIWSGTTSFTRSPNMDLMTWIIPWQKTCRYLPIRTAWQ